MTAFHGSADLKAEVVKRMREHRKADEIVQGIYQKIDPGLASGYKGCLIGCTLPKQQESSGEHEAHEPSTGWHGEVERLYGIPKAIGLLLDWIFEGLPQGEHAEFAVESIEAIPVGADLSGVLDRFLLDLLKDRKMGARRFTKCDTDQRKAIDGVIDLLERRASGEDPTRDEWLTARLSASAATAAAYAARAAGASVAAYAAYAASAAAYAARAASAASAASAAGAAYAAYAASAAGAARTGARHKVNPWLAKHLLHHLRNAPVKEVSGA